MRKIKFRQPIFHKGEFHSWHYWGIIKEGVFVAPTNDVESWGKSQQFTGLHDCEGREIYGGDRIEISNSSGITEIFKIDYNDEYASFRLLDSEGRQCGFLSDWCNQKIKVIGNVFENKDLINGQN